jgi:hypothetical protein
MNGFSNALGLRSTDLDDARFLVISNTAQDAAPTITNTTQFEAWWDTATTTALHIQKTNVAPLFHRVTLTAFGKGGSYQIDGTTTNSSGSWLSSHTRHHLKGTTISLDEANVYGTPEVQFALTEDVEFTYSPCLPPGRKWAIPPVSPCPVLWLSTTGNAGGAGYNSWKDNEIVSFVDPNLSYETGVMEQTNGTFAFVFDLENFTGSADIDAGHYVSLAMAVGGLSLQEGDLLLSTDSSETLTSINSLSVQDEDVFIFRPTWLGNYSSGTFIMVIDGSDVFGDGDDCDEGAIPICDLTGLTLVEEATNVGGQALVLGDFLITGDIKKDVWKLTPTSLGTSTSGGSALLIDGSDIAVSKEWDGLELIETTTVIGDVTLQAGNILGSLDGDDSSVGDNSISVKDEDIFILDLTSAGSSTEGNATLWFDGSDVSLSTNGEDVDVIVLNGQGIQDVGDPLIVRDEFTAVAYDGNNGTQNWSNDWQEIGESNGPSGAEVEVKDSNRCADDKCMEIGGHEVDINGLGLSREVDLSGGTSALLTFNYRRHVHEDDEGGGVIVAVSSNGGTDWTNLKIYNFNKNGRHQGYATFEITGHMAVNTQIRFLGFGEEVDAHLYVDNIQITINF